MRQFPKPEGAVMIPLVLAAVLAADFGQKEAAFEKKVGEARARAVKFLKSKHDKDRQWEGERQFIGFDGANTILATLALLEAGVPTDDPIVEQAVAYLANLEPKKTYVVGLQTQVLARTDAKKYAKELQRNADWLLKTAIEKKNGELEGWSYPANTIADNSNTHFAIAGLHAAAQAGAKVDPDIWKKVRDFYARTQQGGGWLYHLTVGERTTASMTTAGLLGLTLATKYDKDAKGPDPAFDKGMKALLEWKNPTEGKSAAVLWLTTAELGRALGTDTFRSGELSRPWYREGVIRVLKEQQEDGSWKAGERSIDRNYPVITTACALYLLGPPKK